MADQDPKYVSQLQKDEHDNSSAPYTKRVSLYGWNPSTLQKERLVTSNGLLQQSGGLGIGSYDYVGIASGTTSDVYTFRSGGSGGTLVATVTLNYADSTKATLTSVVKT